MDKKSVIIIVSFVILVLIGVIGLFFIEDVTTTYIVKINNIEYGKEDFSKFLALLLYETETELASHQHEEGEELDHSHEVDMKKLKTVALDNYIYQKKYYQEAIRKGLTIDQDSMDYIDNYYNTEIDKERLQELGVTEDDFVKIYKELMLVRDFVRNIDQYYELPQGIYESYKQEAISMYNTYNLRTMQFPIEENEDGILDKDAILEKAQTAMERVKAGEDFETVAKELASSRAVEMGDGYAIINGELESIPQLLIGNTFTDINLYNTIIELEEGEYTDIIETGSYAFMFVRLESITEGVSEEGEAKIQKLLTREYVIQLIESNTIVIRNTKALSKI